MDQRPYHKRRRCWTAFGLKLVALTVFLSVHSDMGFDVLAWSYKVSQEYAILYKIVIYANVLFFASTAVASTLYHRSYLDTLHVHWILSALPFSMHV